MTWLFVSTRPWGEMMMPVPAAALLSSVVLMFTTESSTRLAIASALMLLVVPFEEPFDEPFVCVLTEGALEFGWHVEEFALVGERSFFPPWSPPSAGGFRRPG